MVQRRKKSTSQEILAENVRRLRKESGLSQDAFAEYAGVHRTYVGAVERCEKNITLNNVEKFAIALGVTVPEILTEHSANQSP